MACQVRKKSENDRRNDPPGLTVFSRSRGGLRVFRDHDERRHGETIYARKARLDEFYSIVGDHI